MDPRVEAICARIAAAAEERRPLEIRGGGSKAFYGERPQGELLPMKDLQGVVDYEPSELVLTVRAGTRLHEVEDLLAEHGQMLAFEPPGFGAEATVGGCVAAGLSGPRRPYAGSVRDYVLGVRIVDGRGRLLRFGGQVMKNVAGYDISRLMAGAMGTLGVLTEVSFKVVPRPTREVTLTFDMEAATAIERMNLWAGQPLPLSAACHGAGRLFLRLSGADAAVAAARRRLGGEELAEGERFWHDIREHGHPFFRDRSQLWRASVVPTAPPLAVAGEQFIDWGGAVRWVVDEAGERVRAVAQAAGGHATLFRAEVRRHPVFQPLAPAMQALHLRLKQVFDPRGILNSGRLGVDA